jgi:peroxiredoxin
MSGLMVGDRAPDFTLMSHSGEQVTLSEELKKGPVVLAWYLFDFGRI